jgi:hypothetical protein
MSAVQLTPRDRVEKVLVTALSKLPPQVQLLLGGPRPLRVGGLRMEPEVQLTLRLL